MLLLSLAFVPGEDFRMGQDQVALFVPGLDGCRDWGDVTCRDALVGIALQSRRLGAICDGSWHLSWTGSTVRLRREVFAEGPLDTFST